MPCRVPVSRADAANRQDRYSHLLTLYICLDNIARCVAGCVWAPLRANRRWPALARTTFLGRQWPLSLMTLALVRMGAWHHIWHVQAACVPWCLAAMPRTSYRWRKTPIAHTLWHKHDDSGEPAAPRPLLYESAMRSRHQNERLTFEAASNQSVVVDALGRVSAR